MEKNISSIKTEEQYREAYEMLNRSSMSSKALRFLLGTFEDYRQSRKMGWSRPWNKVNVINFQSFKLNNKDCELLMLARSVIKSEFNQLSENTEKFVDSLLDINHMPMGYVFTQEFDDRGQLYEGAVLSYGRVNVDNRRYRDRLDLVLESQVVDGVSQGLSRISLFVDPFQGSNEPVLWQGVREQGFSQDSIQLFKKMADISWDWAEDQQRIWGHWVTQYIDYFGPRRGTVQKSFFHLATGNANRVALNKLD